MFAQINHVAIISHQYTLLANSTRRCSVSTTPSFRVTDAPICSDGYVGMQIIPRRDGYVGGIDHFGIVVDDVDVVLERMQKKHQEANIVKRPSTRPFAAYSGHDPDGNVFDLAQKKNDTRLDLYAQQANGEARTSAISTNSPSARQTPNNAPSSMPTCSSCSPSTARPMRPAIT